MTASRSAAIPRPSPRNRPIQLSTFGRRARKSQPTLPVQRNKMLRRAATQSIVLLLATAIFASWPPPAVSQSPANPTTADASVSDVGVVGDLIPSNRADSAPNANAPKWKPLTGKWETCKFGGDGPVKLPKPLKPDRVIRLGRGDPLTGIRWTGDFPKENYELRLQGRRVEGFDFFAAVTFPVGDEHCSLVLGGWGGNIVGISSIDGEDASSNPTTQSKQFPNGQWVDIRIRVSPDELTCWLDDQEWVNVPRERHSFDIRIEMDPSLPVGIANYQCVSEIRNLQLRRLPPNQGAVSGSGKATETSP